MEVAVTDPVRETLDLLDYRRQVADLYSEVRRRGADRGAWQRWREERGRLFATHPSSPYDEEARADFPGLAYFDHDPAMRFEAAVEPAEEETFTIGHSAEGGTTARRFATVHFDIGGQSCRLSLFWLDQYGGGLFLPFRDATCGEETYGGGRYLLDSAKSADLGSTPNGRLLLDFNFAYHPSCAHDPRWSCPLAPPENRVPLHIRAGERLIG